MPDKANDTFKQLTDREHVLLRPQMYIGEMTSMTRKVFLNGKEQEVSYVPAILKIINELIDNSIDEYIRSEKKYANKITINMTSELFSISDNGRGIQVVQNAEGIWRPQIAWCEARSGTSFEENRVGAGAHGLGSFATNVFSKRFVGTTCDGKNQCTVYCSDNLENVSVTVVNNKKRGTFVYCEPDFKRFSVEGFSETDINIVKSRISTLSVIYPSIAFEFNDEKICFKNKKAFVELFGSVYKIVPCEKALIAVLPSDNNADDYQQYSSIDGLEFVQGGTHEIYLCHELTTALREVILKKHKLEMTLAEIKRGVKLLVVGSEFPNMKFSSQTKERLTNTEAEVKAWLNADIDWKKIAKDLVDLEDFINPIIETKLARQMAAEKRQLTLAQKKMNKVYIENYLAAKSKNVSIKTLLLVEGLSAYSEMSRVRDIERHGCLPLRGMPMNCYGMKDSKILENREFYNIMSILNLNFDYTEAEVLQNITYSTIGIMTDSDTDGVGGIMPLLLNFFYHWPILFQQKIIKMVPSPRYILSKNRGKKNEERTYCYSKEEYENVQNKKNYTIRYIKGLGSLDSIEYKFVINNSANWIPITIDNPSCLGIMFGNDVNARRNIMEI